ncbi:MAG TPA: hypothetical protein VFF52_12345 [Isosphaeraceae bacterium]|nr:hypothetical protein [Isosphaeraceae bacterium]
MSARERRPITLFDLLILAGATALGLSLVQFGWPRQVAGAWIFTWPLAPSHAGGYPSKTWVLPIAERAAPFLPCLAAWTGAFLVTRLCGPCPRRRRLLRQPGVVAAVAALSILTIESMLLIGSAWFDGRFKFMRPPRINEFVANGVVLLAHHAGWAVLVSWLTLVLIGQWYPEPSWVDRWGRVLGCTWILVGPVASLLIDHAPWWGSFLSG